MEYRIVGRIQGLAISTGLLAIAVGSLYAFRFFNPIEAEGATWGRWCQAAGLLALGAALWRNAPKWVRSPATACS